MARVEEIEMIKESLHSGISVEDMEKSSAFYTDVSMDEPSRRP